MCSYHWIHVCQWTWSTTKAVSTHMGVDNAEFNAVPTKKLAAILAVWYVKSGNHLAYFHRDRRAEVASPGGARGGRLPGLVAESVAAGEAGSVTARCKRGGPRDVKSSYSRSRCIQGQIYRRSTCSNSQILIPGLWATKSAHGGGKRQGERAGPGRAGRTEEGRGRGRCQIPAAWRLTAGARRTGP